MATATDLSDLLSSFTNSCTSATSSLPSLESLLPPENGISLLDTKNEIFLSYLQALALRNLNVIRSLKDGRSAEDVQKVSDQITAKLVEHRVYLERGVKPLEGKIKYQTDKVVKAAEDEERARVQRENHKAQQNARANGTVGGAESSEEESDEDSEDEGVAEVEQTSYRPNLAGFGQSTETKATEAREKSSKDGVYRPPRVSATSMPTTEQRQEKERRPGRSAAVDEYINTELSTAPLAVPSIGSTIAENGRSTKNARQLAKEQERRDYEETHLMRLPKESKKDLAKQRGRERRGYGGEDLQGLGDAVDRIGELTRKKGREGALEKSRKRRAVEDGPRSDGTGGAFDDKKKRMMKRMKR